MTARLLRRASDAPAAILRPLIGPPGPSPAFAQIRRRICLHKRPPHAQRTAHSAHDHRGSKQQACARRCCLDGALVSERCSLRCYGGLPSAACEPPVPLAIRSGPVCSLNAIAQVSHSVREAVQASVMIFMAIRTCGKR